MTGVNCSVGELARAVFRLSQPTAWDKYRTQILFVCALILLQSGMISGLLYERRRRQIAEVQLRQRMTELAHANRYSMAGELAATISHELNQPFGAILVNSETLDAILQSPAPNLLELRGNSCRYSTR